LNSTSTQTNRIAVWFAWRDLTARHAISGSIVIVMTVALVVAGILLGVGLIRGQEAARLQDLTRRPLAIWVGSTSIHGEFTSEIQGSLERALATRIGKSTGYSIHPFHQVLLQVEHRDGKRVPKIRGRTATANDPILRKLNYRRGEAFRTNEDCGVIVTPEFLAEAGYAESDEPPSKIGLKELGWPALESVTVLGVIDSQLPLKYDFLLAEAYAARLLTSFPRGEFWRVVIGPVPRTMEMPTELSPSTMKLLEQWKRAAHVKVTDVLPALDDTGNPRKSPDGRSYWRLETNSANKAPRVWWEIVNELAENFQQAKVLTEEERADFQHMDFIDADTSEKPDGWENHDAAGVFVNDLSLLDPAADACREVGLATNDDIRKDRKEIGTWAEEWWRLILLAAPVAASGGFAVLMLVNWIRARRKLADIGLLKGIGTTDCLIRRALFAEAVLVWLAGTGLGVIAGTGLGYLISFYRAKVSEDWQLGFNCPAWIYAVTIFLSGIACWASLRLSTWKAVKDPPITSLSRPAE